MATWHAARRLFAGRRDDTFGQLVRYGMVGGVALAADFGTLVALTEWAGWHYLVAAAAGFGIGLVVNYALSIRWVFARRSLDSARAEFGVFAAIGAAGLALNEAVMWGLTDGLSFHYTLSKAIAAIVVFGWNFGVRKWLLFR